MGGLFISMANTPKAAHRPPSALRPEIPQTDSIFNIAAEWGSGFPPQLVRTLYLCLDVFLSLKFNLWLSITIFPILFCAPFRRLPRFLCPLKLNQFELFTYFIHPTYQGGAMVATLYTTRGRLISL